MVNHSGIGGSFKSVQLSDNLTMDPGPSKSSSPLILESSSPKDPPAPDSSTTTNLDPGPQPLVDHLPSEPTGLHHSTCDHRMTTRMQDSIAQQPPQKCCYI